MQKSCFASFVNTNRLFDLGVENVSCLRAPLFSVRRKWRVEVFNRSLLLLFQRNMSRKAILRPAKSVLTVMYSISADLLRCSTEFHIICQTLCCAEIQSTNRRCLCIFMRTSVECTMCSTHLPLYHARTPLSATCTPKCSIQIYEHITPSSIQIPLCDACTPKCDTHMSMYHACTPLYLA